MGSPPETIASTLPTPHADVEQDDRARTTFDRPGERFALGDELGRGGMGRVVAATDRSLERNVAIKQVLSTDTHDLIRFEREVRITAQLEHPSIVPIHEAGRDANGAPFYVMRRIEGEPLSDRIERSADARARLALIPNLLAIVDAAAFAHARQIIHRDIKPSNILLGPYGEALLIDWGLARRLDDPTDDTVIGPAAVSLDDDQLTRTGQVYGTVAYMSPEQARGERVDKRADVYALGATLFCVLAGRPPFDGMSAAERISQAVLGREQLPFDKIDAAVPPELVAIVTKAMSNDLDARYRDAGELAADLRSFLAGQLVAAHRYTTRQRIARFVRRHRVAVTISAIALATVIVLAVLAVTGIVAARDAAKLGEQRMSEHAEAMLLDRAGLLANHDPTRAVALLRNALHGDANKRRARDIASVAAANGITHGSSTAINDSVNVLAISPDGRWLVQAGETGIVRVHELATGATRPLAALRKGTTAAVWTDRGTTITANAQPAGLFLVDVKTGDHHTLDDTVKIGALWATGPDGDRIRYIDTEHRVLVERSTRFDGVPRIVAEEVTTGIGSGELAVVLGHDETRLILGDRVLALGAEAPSAFGLAISLDRTRVAAVIDNEVVEWNVADQIIVNRWQQHGANALVYGPVGLYGMNQNGTLVYFPKGHADPVVIGRNDVGPTLWLAATPTGVAFAFQNGSMVLVDPAGTHYFSFDFPNTRAIAATPRAGYLATGSRDGTVRWWNLAQLTSKAFLQEGSLCAVDTTTIFVVGTTKLYAIDRASKQVRSLLEGLLLQRVPCLGPIAGKLVLKGSGGFWLLDLQTTELHQLPHFNGIAWDRADTLLATRDRELVEVSFDKQPARVRWVAPHPITSFAMTGPWIVVGFDNSIVRLDRAGNVTPIVAGAEGTIEHFGVVDNGDVWWTVATPMGLMLWWGNGSTQRPLRTLQTSVVDWGPVGDRVGLELADGSLWIADAEKIINRGPIDRGRSAAFGVGGRVASVENGRLVVRYLATGEVVTRTMSGINEVMIDRAGNIVTAGGSRVFVYEDPVPEDPELLPAWIDSATNAVVDPDTDELTWK